MNNDTLRELVGGPTARHRQVFTRISGGIFALVLFTALMALWAYLWFVAALQGCLALYIGHSLYAQIRWRKKNGEW